MILFTNIPCALRLAKCCQLHYFHCVPYNPQSWTSQVARWQRTCLPMQETWIRFLGQEDPLKKEMAAHSSILAWEIPRTEEPGGLQSWGRKRFGHD